MSRIIETEYGTEKEPPFVKIYFDTQLSLNNLNKGLTPYVIEFSKYMTYSNDQVYRHMVQASQLVKNNIAASLGVTVKAVDKAISALVKGGVFIPIYRQEDKDNDVVSKKKMRGAYFVNPWVIAKGTWAYIKELRQQIDYVNEQSYCLIETSNAKEGEKKMLVQSSMKTDKNAHQIIKVTIPDKEAYRQLSIFDQQKENDE